MQNTGHKPRKCHVVRMIFHSNDTQVPTLRICPFYNGVTTTTDPALSEQNHHVMRTYFLFSLQGFLSCGQSGGNSARICSSFDTAATDTDVALLETYLPFYSNYKCGKPGNYFFDVSFFGMYTGET